MDYPNQLTVSRIFSISTRRSYVQRQIHIPGYVDPSLKDRDHCEGLH